MGKSRGLLVYGKGGRAVVDNSKNFGSSFGVLGHGLSRREFIRLAGAGAGVVLLPSMLTACTGGQGEEQGGGGNLRFYAASYTPSEPTEDNPNPPTQLTKIVEDYVSAHEGTKIELVPYNEDSSEAFAQWKNTQFAGNQIPDAIYNNPELANQEVGKGWYVVLDDYLQRPNPYVEGNERWSDIFVEGALASTVNADGKQYNLPLDAIDTAIFYNKSIFDDAGVSGPPETWGEFLDACEKIKSAGKTPFFMNAGANGRDYTDWFERQFLDMLYWESREELLALEGGKPDSVQLTTEQFVRAYRAEKLFPKDDRYRESWRLLGQLATEYSQEGFTGASLEDASRFFVNQRVAMYEGTSGDVKLLNDQLKPDFEWDTFEAIPPLTSEETKFATGEAPGRIGIVGAFANYNITRPAEERGNLDLAVDWLMFLSAPQNTGRVVTELGQFIPMVEGADLPKGLGKFAEYATRRTTLVQGFVSRFTPQFGDEYFRTLQSYLLGETDLDQAMTTVDKAMDAAANQLTTQNGWNI